MALFLVFLLVLLLGEPLLKGHGSGDWLTNEFALLVPVLALGAVVAYLLARIVRVP